MPTEGALSIESSNIPWQRVVGVFGTSFKSYILAPRILVGGVEGKVARKQPGLCRRHITSLSATRSAMRSILRRAITKQLQKVFWIHVTRNFIVTSASKLKMLTFPAKWRLVPISPENYFRVSEFRHKTLVSEYQDKLNHGELGLFAEVDGLVVGSIWATVNSAHIPTLVRAYMKVLPGEALIHDIFTGERCRGAGIGPYMVNGIVATLLTEKKVGRIIIDVSVKNRPSLRMMDKIGLQSSQQMLYVSAFGMLMFQKSLK